MGSPEKDQRKPESAGESGVGTSRSRPKRLFELKLPAAGVEIVAVDDGTLIHCSVIHSNACLKLLRADIKQWVESLSWADFKTNQFYLDVPALRDILNVPQGAPECEPHQHYRRRCYDDDESPASWLWEQAQFELTQGRWDQPSPLLPVGGLV